MKIVAIMPVRNEDWILGLSLRALLMWVDEAVILNHCSTDDTQAILKVLAKDHPGRIHILEESDPVWREMAHRQRLLEAAREREATHIAILDADEVLCGNVMPFVREFVETLDPGRFLRGPMRMLHRSINQYRNDRSVWSFSRPGIAVADSPALHWKATNGYDHHHREPIGAEHKATVNTDAIMHLQFADWRRLTAKHALYKVSERIRWPEKPMAEIDRLYSMAVDEAGARFAAVPGEWWEPYAPLMEHLHLDREPWQEAETRRLVAEHGAATFRGLNLFGVAQ